MSNDRVIFANMLCAMSASFAMGMMVTGIALCSEVFISVGAGIGIVSFIASAVAMYVGKEAR